MTPKIVFYLDDVKMSCTLFERANTIILSILRNSSRNRGETGELTAHSTMKNRLESRIDYSPGPIKVPLRDFTKSRTMTNYQFDTDPAKLIHFWLKSSFGTDCVAYRE